MVSALDGKGIADLRTYLAGIVPAGPWHYSEDDVTDVPMRTQAAELTRECIYRFLHQELPYTTTVETTRLEDVQGRLGARRTDDLRRA